MERKIGKVSLCNELLERNPKNNFVGLVRIGLSKLEMGLECAYGWILGVATLHSSSLLQFCLR